MCELENVMVRLNLENYSVHAKVWDLNTHCTYGDLIEPLSYMRIEWQDMNDEHGTWKKLPCIE